MTDTLVSLWRIHPPPAELLYIPASATIGRDPHCDLCLPQREVSSVHASLTKKGEHWQIVDQGSRNGVFVNGQRVGSAEVRPGAVLRMGETVLWAGPDSPFSVRSETLVAQHVAHAQPVLILGEAGSGRRTLAARIHKRSRPNSPYIVVEGGLSPELSLAVSHGTMVCSNASDPVSLLQHPSPSGLRLLVVAENSPVAWPHTVHVPPLRFRLNELPNALSAFLAHRPNALWNADFVEALACHPFSMNFVELRILCAKLSTDADMLTIRDLPVWVKAAVVEARQTTPDQITYDVLDDALLRHRGNVRRVAEELSVARGQLYRVMAALGIVPDSYRNLQSPALVASPIESTGTDP